MKAPLLILLLIALPVGAVAIVPSGEPTPTETEKAAATPGPILVMPDPAYRSQPIPESAPDTAEPADSAAAESPAEDPGDETPGASNSTDEPASDEPAAGESKPTDEAVDEDAVDADAGDEDPGDDGTTEATPQTPPEPEPKPKRVLSPEMIKMRDRVRRTLDHHHRLMLSTRSNTATEIMHACLAFGCQTDVYRGGGSSAGQKVNGVTCLCWNYACGGYQPLVVSRGTIAAKIGYGLQERPSQLLAVLALARVPDDYPMRVGEDVRSVADLVEHEKLTCRSGTDLSLKLVGLARYVDGDATWQNDRGETWSIERIIKEEIAKPVITEVDGGMHRLMGVSCAVARRTQLKKPIDGQYQRAQKFIDEYHEYAMKLQNADGSWGPRFLASRETGRDHVAQLRANGHVLEWLAVSLPEEQLEDARVARSLTYVTNLLNSSRYRSSVRTYGTREIGAVMHALHALRIYNDRFFKPADEEPEPEPVLQAARP